MKTKILLFFCCLLAVTSFSQDSSFQLKDYKYRTNGYKALELSTSFQSSTNDTKDLPFESQSNKLISLAPTWINYMSFFSSDKRWHSMYISLSPSILSQSNKGDSGKVKSTNFQSSMDWSSEDRFYRNRKKFFQLGSDVHATGYFSKQSNVQVTNKTNLTGVNINLFLGLGKGRIESVQDAQMALFILNDLNQQGLLSNSPDAQTTEEFAQLITSIHNSRVFDSRRKRIFELTQIDSFLLRKKIISSPDIRHFSIINDNWTLAFNPERLSGSDWYFQLRPSLQTSKNDQTGKYGTSNSLSTFLGIGPKIGYENHKPINLKWQRNFGSSVSWQIQKTKQNNESTFNGSTSKTEIEVALSQTELNMFYGIGFYPNNRTILNAIININGFYSKYIDYWVLKSYFFLQPSVNFSTDYFISYRTRMFANFSLTYQKQYFDFDYVYAPVDKRRSLSTALSVGINHSFF